MSRMKAGKSSLSVSHEVACHQGRFRRQASKTLPLLPGRSCIMEVISTDGMKAQGKQQQLTLYL